MTTNDHQSELLAESQQRLVDQMLENHRFFVYTIYMIIASIPLWIAWMGLMVIIGDIEPFFIFTIFAPILTITLVISYPRTKKLIEFIRNGKGFLEEAKKGTTAEEVGFGVTAYLNLYFHTLLPRSLIDESAPRAQEDTIRSQFKLMQWMPLIEIALFANVLLGLFFYLRLETEVIRYLPALLILAILIPIMVIRWVFYLKWRRVVSRWMKASEGIIVWGEMLEQMPTLGEPNGKEGPA